eukprot:gene8668-615_t
MLNLKDKMIGCLVLKINNPRVLMNVLHSYKQFNYYTLTSKDKKELLFLLDDVKNPIDEMIDDKTYHDWNSAMIDEITKNNLSVIIRDTITNQMVGYMLLKDYTSEESEIERRIMKHPSIKKYNNLLEDLEIPLKNYKEKIRPKDIVKLVDSGVSKNHLKNGIAIHSLKWVVDHSRNLGYNYLLVEALSPVGIKLARNMVK